VNDLLVLGLRRGTEQHWRVAVSDQQFGQGIIADHHRESARAGRAGPDGVAGELCLAASQARHIQVRRSAPFEGRVRFHFVTLARGQEDEV